MNSTEFYLEPQLIADAYKCIKEANFLLEDGLGKFSELDNNALKLIDINGISNYVGTYNLECYDLSKRMYNTMKLMAKNDEASAEIFKEYFELEFEDEMDDIVPHSGESADGLEYTYYFFGEPDEDTKIILVNPGSGSSFDALKTYIENDELEKGNAIVIAYDWNSNSNRRKNDKAYKIMEEISAQYNIPIENCTTAGFSAGGRYAVEQMADLTTAHPEIKNPVIMLIDSYKAAERVKEEDIKALGDSSAVIFSINRANKNPQEEINHKEWAEQGINFIRVTDNESLTAGSGDEAHKAVFRGYFNNGVFNYQVGEGMFQTGTFTNRKGENFDKYTKPTIYNYEENQWNDIDIDNKSINSTYYIMGLNPEKNNTPTVSLSVDDFAELEDIN